ncbi:MAG: hypothetical protein PUP93_26215 [Rhizonema sp. NSF051]|nr:hypothetical protein [Rhizonema sp. NSF051]
MDLAFSDGKQIFDIMYDDIGLSIISYSSLRERRDIKLSEDLSPNEAPPRAKIGKKRIQPYLKFILNGYEDRNGSLHRRNRDKKGFQL